MDEFMRQYKAQNSVPVTINIRKVSKKNTFKQFSNAVDTCQFNSKWTAISLLLN